MNSKMNSYWCLVLSLFLLIYRFKLVNNSIIPSTQILQSFRRYDNVLITLLQDCNFQLKNIIVFDNSRSSTAASVLSNLQAPIGIKLKSLLEIDELYLRSQVDPIEIQGLIIIINNGDEWPIIRQNIALFWELNNNCTIFLVLKVPGACQYSPNEMQIMAQLHFAKTFYICMHEKFSEPAIYTHDPYGDTKPLNWLRIQQKEVNLCNWTLYRRIYNEVDTCEGFIFNRTDLSKHSRIMIAVSQEITTGEELVYIYEGDAHNIKEVAHVHDVIKIERLLNMKFTYYVQYYLMERDINEQKYHLLTMTATSVIFKPVIFGSRKPYQIMSYPIYYDYNVILSKDRGPATPLEKIANFYGIWTLISLLVVLILSFIVIWFKTDGYIAFACFDILRLLINLGIVTPINTLPLKIFFTMIFLYFMVIHSTFSGQLSKFLTVPEHLRNINSLGDLTDPRIEIVNNFFFVLNDEDESTKVIAKKSVHRTSQTECFLAIINKTNDVCIGPYLPFQRTIINLKMKGYYLSKKALSLVQAYATYRQRFPLIEKFNWALIALSETRILFREGLIENERVSLKAKRLNESERQNFRPISLSDLKFAFVLLIIGNSISFILLLFEISVSQYHKMIKKIRGLCQISRLRNKFRRRRIRLIQVQPIVM